MAGTSALRIHRRYVAGGISIVFVSGEIDLATAPTLRDSLSPHLSDPGTATLVVDLTQVKFLACSGLSVLIEVQATLAARDARLCVVAISPAVLRPMTVTGLVHTMPVHPSLSAALARIAPDRKPDLL